MNKLSKNYLMTGGYQLLTILIMLIITPYLTRTLGSESLGIDAYVLSIVQICQIMGSLGSTVYANREIAYVREDRNRPTCVFWELFLLRILLGSLVTVIYLVIAFHSAYKAVFLIQLITLLSYYLDVSWLYIGTEDIAPLTLCSAAVRLCTTPLIFLFVKEPAHLNLYVAIYAVTLALICGILLAGARKRVGRLPFGQLNLGRHLRPVIALFLPQAASSLYVMFDKTMLGLLASDFSRVSIYEKPELIVKAPTVLAMALTTVTMPRIAFCHARRRREDIKKLVRNSLELVFLLFIPISAGAAIVAPIFIPAYLGPAYTDSIRVVWILAPIILAIAMTNVSGSQFLTGCNETRYLAVSYMMSALFNIAGNFILIPRLDEIGASITTLCAEWMVVVIQFRAMYRILGRIGIVDIAYKKVIAGAVMAAAIFPLPELLGRTLPVMLLQIIAGAGIYFIALVVMRDSGLFDRLNMLRDRNT